MIESTGGSAAQAILSANEKIPCGWIAGAVVARVLASLPIPYHQEKRYFAKLRFWNLFTNIDAYKTYKIKTKVISLIF